MATPKKKLKVVPSTKKPSAKRPFPDLPDAPITLKTIYDAVVNLHNRLNRMEFGTDAIKGGVDMLGQRIDALESDKLEPLQMALAFHEAYERLAPSFGYETRKETRAFDPTSPNGKLMIAVCGELARSLERPEPSQAQPKPTEAQYRILADRMIEEHRKYGDRLRPGHWAEIAARKVVGHINDFREVNERTFTESEMRAMIASILRETEQVPSVNGGFIDIIFPSNVRGAVKECGIVLDPA